jgi:hypothetical protein
MYQTTFKETIGYLPFFINSGTTTLLKYYDL